MAVPKSSPDARATCAELVSPYAIDAMAWKVIYSTARHSKRVDGIAGHIRRGAEDHHRPGKKHAQWDRQSHENCPPHRSQVALEPVAQRRHHRLIHINNGNHRERRRNRGPVRARKQLGLDA